MIVHGLNFVWKRAPYVPPDSPEGFTAADADWLYEHGFNGARLGVLWPGVNPTAPGVVDPTYFEKWDRVVDLMADKGIWMQFDMHQDQWHETYGGEGVPNWAVQRPFPWSLLPFVKVPFPLAYWTPEVSTVFDHFWANKRGLLDHWVTYWKQVAQHYKDQPYSMGYDLINEPWVGNEWATCLLGGCGQSYVKELQPAQNKALAGIRSVDPHNIVWYEPQQLSGGLLLPTYLKAVPGEANLGLSWHSYCSATFLASMGIPLDLTEACPGFADEPQQARARPGREDERRPADDRVGRHRQPAGVGDRRGRRRCQQHGLALLGLQVLERPDDRRHRPGAVHQRRGPQQRQGEPRSASWCAPTRRPRPART